jgi:hypothetical protein
VKCLYKLVTLLGVLLAAYGLAAESAAVFEANAEAQILAELNQSRAEAGAPALKLDAKLTDAARHHSLLLANRHVLSHQFPNEPALSTRLRNAGAIFTTAAENVGMNTELSDVNAMFLRSPGHRINMLNPDYDAVGIGVVHQGAAYWITEDFARLTPALSARQAEDEAAAALEAKWKTSQGSAPRRVVMEELRAAACQAARSGGKIRRTGFTFEGKPAQEVIGFSSPDPAALPSQVGAVIKGAHIGAYAVGACTPDHSGELGQFWVVMAFF